MNMMNSLVGGYTGANQFIEKANTDTHFKEDFLDFIGWGSERRAYERELASANTAYQRAVADMRNAGLNPYLAYQQGGANSAVAMASRGHLKDIVNLVGTAFNLASGLSNSAGKLARTAFKMQNRPNVTNNNYFLK